MLVLLKRSGIQYCSPMHYQNIGNCSKESIAFSFSNFCLSVASHIFRHHLREDLPFHPSVDQPRCSDSICCQLRVINRSRHMPCITLFLELCLSGNNSNIKTVVVRKEKKTPIASYRPIRYIMKNQIRKNSPSLITTLVN